MSTNSQIKSNSTTSEMILNRSRYNSIYNNIEGPSSLYYH